MRLGVLKIAPKWNIKALQIINNKNNKENLKWILQGKFWIYFELNYIDISPLTVFSIHLFDQPRCTFCKLDQIHRKLRIWSYLLKRSLMENFIFCAVTFASPDIAEFYFLLCQSYSRSGSLPKETSKFIILLFLEFSTMEINSFSLCFLLFDFLSIFLCLMLYYVLSFSTDLQIEKFIYTYN